MRTSHPNYISIALYRLSFLAFAVGLISLVCVVLMSLALTQQKPVLVAVDDRGRLHGYIEYLDPTQRSEAEIKLALGQFISSYLSINSDTILQDMQLALSMMAPSLMEREKNNLISTNRIAMVQDSRLNAVVDIEQISISRRAHDRLVGVVRGVIDTPQENKSFAIELQARIRPRSSHNSFGLTIVSITDH